MASRARGCFTGKFRHVDPTRIRHAPLCAVRWQRRIRMVLHAEPRRAANLDRSSAGPRTRIVMKIPTAARNVLERRGGTLFVHSLQYAVRILHGASDTASAYIFTSHMCTEARRVLPTLTSLAVAPRRPGRVPRGRVVLQSARARDPYFRLFARRTRLAVHVPTTVGACGRAKRKTQDPAGPGARRGPARPSSCVPHRPCLTGASPLVS